MKSPKCQNFRAARAELRRSFIREIFSIFEFGIRSFIEGGYLLGIPRDVGPSPDLTPRMLDTLFYR